MARDNWSDRHPANDDSVTDSVRRRTDYAGDSIADTAEDVDATDEGHATTGGAAAAGAATGAVIGLVGGPIGAAVGAVGGAIVGAITERVMHGDEGHDHVEGDDDHYVNDHDHTGDDDGHDHSLHYNEYANRPAAREMGVGATAGSDFDRTDRDHDRDTIQLREEELEARKRRVQSGEVTVGKEVVTEERTMDVPVTREEVYVERHPVNREVSGDVDMRDDSETIRVPVMEEEVEVGKRAFVTEEVSVGKRTVQDTERVSGTVRREEAVIEGDTELEGETGRGGYMNERRSDERL